jgi:antitoxin component of RelBE/YafQ-DinJ toxin-antitoxin module
MGLKKTVLLKSRVSEDFKEDVEGYAESIGENTSSVIRIVLTKEMKKAKYDGKTTGAK